MTSSIWTVTSVTKKYSICEEIPQIALEQAKEDQSKILQKLTFLDLEIMYPFLVSEKSDINLEYLEFNYIFSVNKT